MRIVITGATGMLGRALCKAFSRHCVHPLSSRDLDVTCLPAVRKRLSDLQPDCVIHAAARTAVDEAELNPFRAYQVNALGARNVALCSMEVGGALVYYSTDYVFDGRQNRPYREWDPPRPVNEYGRSKLAGEFFVRSLCPHHLIIRTSWLFGSGGAHFVQKILNRAQEQNVLQVVDDQRGSPTFTTDLAYMTLCLVEGEKRGTYHVTNAQDCSWYELACQIVSLKKLAVKVNPIDSQTLSAPAPRPSYSVLDNYVLKLEGVPLLRPWQNALSAFLRE